MTKTRVGAGGVRWTDPTGRCWTSPAQHAAPTPAVRPQPLTVLGPDLSPGALAELLADADSDPGRYELRATAHRADEDRIGDALRDDDEGWGLALDDPYRWTAGPDGVCRDEDDLANGVASP